MSLSNQDGYRRPFTRALRNHCSISNIRCSTDIVLLLNMRLLYCSLSLLFLFVVIPQTTVDGATLQFTYCGTTGGTIRDLQLFPDMPRGGSTITFRSYLQAKKDLTSGTFRSVVTRKVFGVTVTVLIEEKDLCDLIRGGGCPIEAGSEIQFEYKSTIPFFTPPGLYSSETTYYDQDENLYVCFKTSFNVFSPFSASRPT